MSPFQIQKNILKATLPKMPETRSLFTALFFDF